MEESLLVQGGEKSLTGFFSEDIAKRVVGITPVIGLSIPYWRQREIEQYLFDMNQPSRTRP